MADKKPRKKVSLQSFTKRHKGWRKKSTDSVLIEGSDEEIVFHWLYPSGVDIAMMSSMTDEKELSKLQKGTTDESRLAAQLIGKNYDKVGEFLVTVLCDDDENLLYDSLEDFNEAGFGNLDAIQVYLQIFNKITEQIGESKKKSNKKK